MLYLIIDGNKFPSSYLLDVEQDRLEFDEHFRVKNVTSEKAMFLLMSSFITKGLVTTLFLKPVKFTLLNTSNPIVQNNFKIMATLVFYIVRMVNDLNSTLMDFAWELQAFLYSDKEMEAIYKHEDVDSMLNRSKMLFKVWINEYVTKLDEAGLIKRE